MEPTNPSFFEFEPVAVVEDVIEAVNDCARMALSRHRSSWSTLARYRDEPTLLMMRVACRALLLLALTILLHNRHRRCV